MANVSKASHSFAVPNHGAGSPRAEMSPSTIFQANDLYTFVHKAPFPHPDQSRPIQPDPYFPKKPEERDAALMSKLGRDPITPYLKPFHPPYPRNNRMQRFEQTNVHSSYLMPYAPSKPKLFLSHFHQFLGRLRCLVRDVIKNTQP